MKKPPDVIVIPSVKKDVRKINLYCLMLYAFDRGDKYLLLRAIERLNQLNNE